MRSWFHEHVAPAWPQFVRDTATGSRLAVDTPAHSFYTMLATIRRRGGFARDTPTLAAIGGGRSVTAADDDANAERRLRSDRARAQVVAHRSTVSQLDLSMSYDMCTADERRVGVLLRPPEVRHRLAAESRCNQGGSGGRGGRVGNAAGGNGIAAPGDDVAYGSGEVR